MRSVARVLFIENHDSFSWNVIDALPWARSEVHVARGPQVSLEGFDVVVMGPGPTDPLRAGLVELVQEAARRALPFLGICLGHQALGLAFGARLVRNTPAHGKRARARFDDGRVLEVMRYHSLALEDVRAPLQVTARLDDGTVMAVRHTTLPMVGYQFHPDSFGTPEGRTLLETALPLRPAQKRPAPIASVPPRAPKSGSQGHRVALSSLATVDDFALLAPGYADHGQWTLLRDLRPAASGPLWFATAEGTAQAFTADVERCALELDVAPAALQPRLDAPTFTRDVESIRARIAAGDVYQVNLTLRAALGEADGAGLFSRLCSRGVPRFAAWVKSPHLGELVTASPELLFETAGRTVRAEPMKGTAPPSARAWLEASEKDRAELAMITDLLRDDLQHVCEPGSVRVPAERRFLELPYVVQAVADVTGALREGVELRELLSVLHPGGSVTGAPREAALAVIDELEPTPRGAYCGTLGLVGDDGARFSLLIRTAQRHAAGWTYGVGGGITWDSRAEDEWAEVQLKLGALEG